MGFWARAHSRLQPLFGRLNILQNARCTCFSARTVESHTDYTKCTMCTCICAQYSFTKFTACVRIRSFTCECISTVLIFSDVSGTQDRVVHSQKGPKKLTKKLCDTLSLTWNIVTILSCSTLVYMLFNPMTVAIAGHHRLNNRESTKTF